MSENGENGDNDAGNNYEGVASGILNGTMPSLLDSPNEPVRMMVRGENKRVSANALAK